MGNRIGQLPIPEADGEAVDAPFLALNVSPPEDVRESKSASVPDDLFVHIFSFLNHSELARVASVSRLFNECCTDPSLWRILDLSNMYSRVDDQLLIQLVSNGRFREIEVLNLEGCAAVTNKGLAAIARHLSSLRQLWLTDCNQITPARIMAIVRACPLERLELYGCTDDMRLVEDLRAIRPELQLGFFFLEYCAQTGRDYATDGQTPAVCRHAGRVAERGCWGEVRGRIVYSSAFYHRGGNYPHEILYSCQTHTNVDLQEADLYECKTCECTFREASMWNRLVCKVCYDREHLSDKGVWISLTPRRVGQFGFQDVITRTVRIADRKNLPDTLRSYGSVSCSLDYRLPAQQQGHGQGQEEEVQEQLAWDGAGNGLGLDGQELVPHPQQHEEEEEEEEDDPSRPLADAGLQSGVIHPAAVPLRFFLERNRARVDTTVNSLRGLLRRATKNKETRALLLFNSDDQIEVMADQRLTIEGREGHEHMILTTQAWGKALSILWPFMIVMTVVPYLTKLFFDVADDALDTGRTNWTYYLDDVPGVGVSFELALLVAGGLFVGLILIAVLWWRYRDTCETVRLFSLLFCTPAYIPVACQLLKRFLVLDLLLILALGALVALLLISAQFNDSVFKMDSPSFALLVWNFSVGGIVALYLRVPPPVHRFYLASLNAFMAILLLVSVTRWVLLLFVFMAALLDLVSEMRPRFRFLNPFLIPNDVELLLDTPRILYQIGNLRLRGADLMWYGLLVGLAPSALAPVAIAWVGVIACIAIIVFVFPFLGRKFRPLPAAVAVVALVLLLQADALLPFLRSANFATTRPVHIPADVIAMA